MILLYSLVEYYIGVCAIYFAYSVFVFAETASRGHEKHSLAVGGSCRRHLLRIGVRADAHLLAGEHERAVNGGGAGLDGGDQRRREDSGGRGRRVSGRRAALAGAGVRVRGQTRGRERLEQRAHLAREQPEAHAVLGCRAKIALLLAHRSVRANHLQQAISAMMLDQRANCKLLLYTLMYSIYQRKILRRR